METPVLHRMLRKPPDAPVGTPDRALRLAIVRAFDRMFGVPVSVDVALSEVDVDDLAASLSDGVIIGLDRGIAVGLLACDPPLVAALTQMQTIGRVVDRDAAPRPITATDRALCLPFLAACFDDLVGGLVDTDLADWLTAVTIGAPITTPRQVPMILAATTYRVVRFAVRFGDTSRAAEVVIALPPAPKPQVKAPSTQWADNLRQSVLETHAQLNGILARISLPLSQVEGLSMGDVVPLYGATVGSVRLEGPDETCVAMGRLGQMAGQRAVRIEPAQPAQLSEVTVADPPRQAAPLPLSEAVDTGSET